MGFFSDFWKNIILREQTSTDKGYISAVEKNYLLGCRGMVKNELRPAGTAIFDESNTPVDVVSEGDYILKGATVEVIGINGSRVVVREVKDNSTVKGR